MTMFDLAALAKINAALEALVAAKPQHVGVAAAK